MPQTNSNRYNNKIISQEKYYDFRDVLILPKTSSLNSRSHVNLNRTIRFNNNISWTGVPIVASNMTTVGTFDVYKVLSKQNIITAFHKFYKLQDFIDFNNENPNDKLNPEYFMVSTGISGTDYENLVHILDNFEVKFICVDVANGYISNLKQFCRQIRDKYQYKIIMAGNVVTKEGVDGLIDCGVDIIKVGIGPGSACTTRIQTGIGMPQFSCVLECAEAIASKKLVSELLNTNNLNQNNNGPNLNQNNNKNLHYIISDGGITCPGDLAKAFGGGSDFVMIGGEFAGHDENPGDLIVDEETGERYKFFYGMSSSYAMKNNYATNNNTSYRSSEGREIKIKYKGQLNNTVQNYLGGIRSTCTYTNSAKIEDLAKNCKFILVNNQYNTNLVNGK